jgi:hypothetical protein
MLIAARSSQDFACCWRATASACSKYASACQINMRKVDGWQTLTANLIGQPIDLAA